MPNLKIPGSYLGIQSWRVFENYGEIRVEQNSGFVHFLPQEKSKNYFSTQVSKVEKLNFDLTQNCYIECVST